MKGFYVTAQCSQDISDTGWHTEPVFAKDRDDALRRFNEQARATPGWLQASIESVVESRVHGNPVVAGPTDFARRHFYSPMGMGDGVCRCGKPRQDLAAHHDTTSVI